jgi:hypothetical protein
MERRRIDRRELFKRAGVGSAALASIPALAGTAWADDDDDDTRRRFYFQALSGQGAAINLGDTIIMSGCGSFGHRSVRGGGEFVHFEGTDLPAVPDIVATGSWRATRFVSFSEVGTFGVGVSGILEMQIKLLPCDRPVVRGATLVVVCNIGPARLMTGQPEGFVLTVPGMAPFRQFHPEAGLTFFTRPCDDEEEEEEDD